MNNNKTNWSMPLPHLRTHEEQFRAIFGATEVYQEGGRFGHYLIKINNLWHPAHVNEGPCSYWVSEVGYDEPHPLIADVRIKLERALQTQKAYEEKLVEVKSVVSDLETILTQLRSLHKSANIPPVS